MRLSRPSQWHLTREVRTFDAATVEASCCFISSVCPRQKEDRIGLSVVLIHLILFLFPLQSNRILPELLQRLHVTDRYGLQRLLPSILWPASKFDAPSLPVPENTAFLLARTNNNASLDLMPWQEIQNEGIHELVSCLPHHPFAWLSKCAAALPLCVCQRGQMKTAPDNCCDGGICCHCLHHCKSLPFSC